MQKMSQCGLMALSLFTGIAASGAVHAEVLNIPWEAAMQTSDSPADCTKGYPSGYGSWTEECYLAFPISIPVGHTIQQISVLHGTNNAFPGGQPFIEADLEVVTLAPNFSETSKFIWTSTAAVPDFVVERHPLMAQVGKLYYDQFQVAPYTIYNVSISLAHGSFVSAIEVTYN